MATSPVITRRAALVGAIASSAALAVPAVAAITETEHPNIKVRRLASEIAAALRDERYLGFKRITITPDYVANDDTDNALPVKARLARRLAAVGDTMDELAGDGWVIIESSRDGKRWRRVARTWVENETITRKGRSLTIPVDRSQHIEI